MTESSGNWKPGFYPDGSGNERYWNGEKWLDQTRPIEATPTTETASSDRLTEPEPTSTVPTSTSPAPDPRPWFKKKRFIIPGAVVALLVVAGIAGSAEEDPGGSDDTKPIAIAKTQAPDADNDGVPDSKDAFPSDAAESEDADANGVGDNADKAAADKAAAAKKAADDKAAADKARKAIANAPFVSKRQLAQVFKDPDSHAGEMFKVWGEVMQFDAATGTDSFLAYTAHTDTRSYGIFDGESAFFTGDESALSKFVEEDLFVATVKVNGSLSYDTQIGGNTTVPEFQILRIKRP